MKPLPTLILVLALAVLAGAAPSHATEVAGDWIAFSADTAGDVPFRIAFIGDGTYRAECRDPALCSLCGGGPIVETGTYRVSGGVVTVTITASNAPNSALRIGSAFVAGSTLSATGALSLTNARALTFDWSSGDTVTLVQTATSVERNTWRAIKALFR